METFPIRPLFDRVIVREIPIEDYYEKTDLVNDDLLRSSFVKERSDRGVVVAAGRNVEEVKVGDVVQYDEYCLSDPIFLNPAHKNRTDLPKYWQIRVPDLKGVRIGDEPKYVHQTPFVSVANCDHSFIEDSEIGDYCVHCGLAKRGNFARVS